MSYMTLLAPNEMANNTRHQIFHFEINPAVYIFLLTNIDINKWIKSIWIRRISAWSIDFSFHSFSKTYSSNSITYSKLVLPFVNIWGRETTNRFTSQYVFLCMYACFIWIYTRRSQHIILPFAYVLHYFVDIVNCSYLVHAYAGWCARWYINCNRRAADFSIRYPQSATMPLRARNSIQTRTHIFFFIMSDVLAMVDNHDLPINIIFKEKPTVQLETG